jgi:heme exporter protein D
MIWPFHSVTEFLHMGGYARYVWTAFFMTALVLIGNIIVPYYQQRKLKRGRPS